MEKRAELVRFGDEHSIKLPDEPIDCTPCTYFDELENDCWELVKKYSSAFGIVLVSDSGDDEAISFDVAKGVQEYIIKLFEEIGVEFKFTHNAEMTMEEM